MGVGAVGNEADVVGFESCFEGLGVVDYGLGVDFEIVLLGKFEGDGFCRCDVVVWAALEAWHDGFVDFGGVLFFAEYESPTWASEGFVSGGCDYIGIWDRIGMQAGDDKGVDMRNVG